MKSKKLFLVFVTIAVIVLSSCGKDDNVTFVSIAITSQPTKKTYLVDETFDPAGMVVTATYSDKSTTPVTINADNLTYDFSMAGTNKIVTITVTCEGKTATATVTGITVNSILELVVTVLGEYTYNGAPIEPSGEDVTIKHGDITLTKDDYTLSYSSNINAGIASITATGKGDYARSVGTANFTINPIVSIFSVTVTGIYSFNGMPVTPSDENVTVKHGDMILAEYDYTLSYSSNIFEGTAIVMVTGTGNYAGSSGTGFFTILLFAGSGTSDNPYEINSPAQLARLATMVNTNIGAYNNYYKLTADISLSDYGSEFNDGKGWIPIGYWTAVVPTVYRPFRGHFDGNNHKVSKLYINDADLNHAGLFGLIAYGSTVRNLGVEGNVTAHGYIGGIVGEVTSNSSVINCYTTGMFSGIGTVGGVVGQVYSNSNLTYCYSSGVVSGSHANVGGVVGVVGSSGNVNNCYATGTINGGDYIGGVAGQVNEGNISNCYASGAVSGNDFIGGVAGIVINGSVKNCAALNPSVTFTTGSTIGRVAGLNWGTLTNNVAWDGMLVNGSAVKNSDSSSVHGADITKTSITSDGRIGGRFTINDGWTIENGKLPGIGTAVTLPEHLK